MQQNQHGGKRKGAGRKPSPIKTETISFRVNTNQKDQIKDYIKKYIKGLKIATN